MRNSYIRPDMVYRSGSVRPFTYGNNPVEEARAIAVDFTRDPSIINKQFPASATYPNVENVQQAPMVARRTLIVPSFIRRFFGGR